MRQARRGLWAVMLTALVVASTGQGHAAGSKLDPILQLRLGQLFGSSRVVITAPSSGALGSLTSLIRQLGGTLGPLLPVINGRAAIVPNISLVLLNLSPLVARVSADRLIVGSMERTGATIGATGVRQELGVTGAGVGVAVIDSGIIPWHDDLSDAPGSSPRIAQFVDFVHGSGTPSDDNGHGTHVAGIIAGNGLHSDGRRTGIAPGAHLVVLKVLDRAGQGRISNVIAAIDYAVSHRADLNIRVINMSVATVPTESVDLDPLAQATKAATDAGIVVVAAAGNNGRGRNGRMQYGGITAPGNAPWVLTVGASSHQGTVDRTDDTIATFSSRGPTSVDRAAKPDLLAPGVGIESLSAPNSSLYNSRGPYLLDGVYPTWFRPYLSLSGTSQAAPVVAGTVALMLEANPDLTPNAVKAILQYTAEVDPTFDPLTEGAGFVNAWGAVELARYFALPFFDEPSGAGWSKAVHWGNQRISGGRLLPTANAWGINVEWGKASTSSGERVAWGEICASDCGTTPVWEPWQVICGDANCDAVTWGSGTSMNLVWGTSCGGADCSSGASWNARTSGDTVVWGTANADTVVWGTSNGDTVVWGTECSDPSCEPVVWQSQ
jgi:serine protease AprX